MFSIVTAVYNQLPMNRLFRESLVRYTDSPFELLIIDNGSTDGSDEYFAENGATVIRNGGNYSYPWCQNRGADAAGGTVLCFFNNDIIVGPHWDSRVRAVMEAHQCTMVSCCATDRCESDDATRRSQRRWKYIRNPLQMLLGSRYRSLQLMHALMYGNWERWCETRHTRFGTAVSEGIAGSNVIMTRSALDTVGRWDERIQAADFDLMIRSKLRSINYGDIKPVHLIHGVYMHHFIRLTAKKKYPPFTDGKNLIGLNDKWDPDTVNPLLASSGMRIKRKAPRD